MQFFNKNLGVFDGKRLESFAIEDMTSISVRQNRCRQDR